MSKKIFMIAGEASGDALGGSLMDGLKKAIPDIEITGVGGIQMQAQGLESLLKMQELCVLGLVEVVEHLPG